VKNTASDFSWDFSRLLCGIAAGSLVVLATVTGKPAAAQSADAQERCTEDVMRLCSEFVPDADSIVVCLKAKRLQLNPVVPERPRAATARIAGVSNEKLAKSTTHGVAG
jgi:hypothetical protein